MKKWKPRNLGRFSLFYSWQMIGPVLPLSLQDPNKSGDPGMKHAFSFVYWVSLIRIHLQRVSRIFMQIVITKSGTQILVLFSNIHVPWFLSEEIGSYNILNTIHGLNQRVSHIVLTNINWLLGIRQVYQFNSAEHWIHLLCFSQVVCVF